MIFLLAHLGGQLLSGGLATGGLAGGLLGTSHCFESLFLGGGEGKDKGGLMDVVTNIL